MYGWHKIQDVTSGAIQSGDEVRQFKSPYFIRGREDLLDNIVRNKGSKGSDDEEGGSSTDLSKILDELDIIKSNQMEIAADLNRIKSDNQLLWRECYESRERHKAHADKFERILRLLASAFSSTQNSSGRFVGDSSTANNLIGSILDAADSSGIASRNRINEDVPVAPGINKPRLLLGNGPTDGQISELSYAGTGISPKYNDDNRISAVPESQGAHLSELSTPADVDTPAVKAAVVTPATTAATTSTDKDPTRTVLFDSVATADFPVDPLKTASGGSDELNQLPPPSSSPIYSTTPQSVVGGEPNPEDFELINPLVDAPVTTTPSLSVDTIPAVASGSAASPQQPWLDGDIDPNTELLSANDNNLEELIRSIDFQGDSLQRIQDRLAKYLPSDNLDDYQNQNSSSPTKNVTPTVVIKQEVDKQDPGFDVDDFLLNANLDDLGESGDEGPVKKKAKH